MHGTGNIALVVGGIDALCAG